ncbi:DnaJ domain-containing protein [Pilaira anomala]|nr:DnaJ domain-containing protein [Pilaira anomala]
MEKEDYYQILGVSKNANEIEIKKAYRRLALEYHPDRNKQEGAKLKFQKIAEAFEILSDKSKRQQYDARQQYQDNNSPPLSTYSNDIYTGFSPEELFAQFFQTTPHSPFSSDDDDFFSFFHQQAPPSPPPQKPRSVKRSLPVSLDDLYTGTTKRLKVSRTIYNKQGRTVPSDKVLTVNVLPGWKSGTKIRFPDEGDQFPNGERQDIEFEIKEKPHPVFTRKGCNLYTTMTISLLEALTGFRKEIKRLDGSSLIVQEPESSITQSGQEKIIIGEGMPNYKSGEKGDLFLRFQVEFPKSLTPKQRETLKSVLA